VYRGTESKLKVERHDFRHNALELCTGKFFTVLPTFLQCPSSLRGTAHTRGGGTKMCSYSSLQHIKAIQTLVLLIAVTDNEVMYISVNKKYINLTIHDSQLCDADKKTSLRGHCVTHNISFRTATYLYLH